MRHLLAPIALICASALPLLAQEAATPAPAATDATKLSQEVFDPKDYLADTRWTDGCYGVSLNDPKGMARSAYSARWISPKDGPEYGISLNFLLPPPRADNRPPQPMALKDSWALVLGNLAGGQGHAEALPQFTRDFVVDKHPCSVSYFLLQPQVRHRQNGRADAFLIGVGVLQVTPYNHLTLRLTCRIPANAAGEQPFLVDAQRKLESMLASVRTTPESTLLALREAQLARGGQALKLLTPERIRQTVPAEQVLRIVQNGKDLGWMRLDVRQQDAAWYAKYPPQSNAVDGLRQNGLMVAVRTHTQSGDAKDEAAVDGDQRFFKADASPYETWQRTTTWRDGSTAPQTATEMGFLLPPRNTDAVASLCVEWAGTAPGNLANFFAADPQWRKTTDEKFSKIDSLLKRAEDRDLSSRRITSDVDRDGKPIPVKGDLIKYKWGMPLAQPYLPQAHAWLLPWLLPANAAQSYSFAFYSPESKRPGFCLLKVAPAEDGSRRVFFRPALDQPEQVFSFDAAGRLLRIQLPDGTALIPASADEMVKIWKLAPAAEKK